MITLASVTGTKPSRRNTAMCLTGHFCLMSLQIFLISFSAIGRYASYSKLMTFFPSKLFLVVPEKKNYKIRLLLIVEIATLIKRRGGLFFNSIPVYIKITLKFSKHEDLTRKSKDNYHRDEEIK